MSGKTMASFWNMMGIPYYRVIVTHNGRAIWGTHERVSKITRNRIFCKPLKRYLKMPELYEIPPVQIKSGFLVIWDSRNAINKELMSESKIQELMKTDDSFIGKVSAKLTGEENALGVIEPSYFVPKDLNPEVLHDFFESNAVSDAMGIPKSFPDWVLPIVVVMAAMLFFVIIAFMFFNSASPHVVNTTAQQVSAMPTPYMIISRT